MHDVAIPAGFETVGAIMVALAAKALLEMAGLRPAAAEVIVLVIGLLLMFFA